MMVKEWPEPEARDQIEDEMDADFDDEFSTYDDEDFSEAA
jgi:hypothetical protein